MTYVFLVSVIMHSFTRILLQKLETPGLTTLLCPKDLPELIQFGASAVVGVDRKTFNVTSQAFDIQPADCLL